DRLQISELNGAIFSGTLQGNADIPLAKGDQRYQATMSVDRVDFPRLTDLYFKYKTSIGSMNGRYDWTGNGGDARSMSGKGGVEVYNGDVFDIPLFGPLSGRWDRATLIFSMIRSISMFASTPAGRDSSSPHSINFSNTKLKAA